MSNRRIWESEWGRGVSLGGDGGRADGGEEAQRPNTSTSLPEDVVMCEEDVSTKRPGSEEEEEFWW